MNPGAIESVDGAHIEDVAISNVAMRDVSNAPIFIRPGARVRAPFDTPEREKERPEPSMFGLVPAPGFFIQHARGADPSAAHPASPTAAPIGPTARRYKR